MTTSLRPMSLGEILDHAVQMMSSNLVLFAGIAVVPGLASLAQTIASIHPHDISGSTFTHTLLVLASYGASFVTWIASIVLTALGSAVVCLATSKLLLDEPVTIRASYASLASQSGRMIWLGFLQGLFAAWPLIIVIFIVTAFVSGASHGNGPGTFILVAVLSLPGIVGSIALYARYALAYPAAAIENTTASTSIDRSVELGRDSRWKICWAVILPGGVGLVAILGASALLKLLAWPGSFLASSPVLFSIADGVVIFVLNLFFSPFYYIVLTLMYYDLRVRKEGFDIERMLVQAHTSGAPQSGISISDQGEGIAPEPSPVMPIPQGGSSQDVSWNASELNFADLRLEPADPNMETNRDTS